MSTHIIPPADLLAGDEIRSVNGHKWGGVTFVRIDKTDPQFIRLIVSRKGAEYYEMVHPEHRIEVSR